MTFEGLRWLASREASLGRLHVFTVFAAKCPVFARMCSLSDQMCPTFSHQFAPNVSTRPAHVFTQSLDRGFATAWSARLEWE